MEGQLSIEDPKMSSVHRGPPKDFLFIEDPYMDFYPLKTIRGNSVSKGPQKTLWL